MLRFATVSLLVAASSVVLFAQDPLSFTIATPRPINPAASSPNPSALATQSLNPYLGSVPGGNLVPGEIKLTLYDAIQRGLEFNLGLVESNQAGAAARAERARAFSALLPQLTANGRQAYESISMKEIGLKLPPIPGFAGLPPTTGGFGYQDARVNLALSVYDAKLRNQYRARKSDEEASRQSIRDSRDVVVEAVGTAYLQVIASAARVETAKAQLASASELDRQTSDRVTHEVSPEIDSIRAQVERHTDEQRLTNALNQLAKDKLTLARIIGLAVDQDFTLTDPLTAHPLTGTTSEAAVTEALQSRADLRSAEASVHSAEFVVRAQKSQRLPVVSVAADYGGGGSNVGNFSQVYTVGANISVPIYTGGRIGSEIAKARADLALREAEYQDLKGRVAYDVRVAWLDLTESDSSVKVAERNKSLAVRALEQSQDRYANGVTNYLEVVQAQEVKVIADENHIRSLFSFNVAIISLARAMGDAENRLPKLLK